MKTVTVSAPGKLMIMGEHAVVYDRPCIVTAVGSRIKLTIEELSVPEFMLDAADVNVVEYKKSLSEIGAGYIPKGAMFVEVALRNVMQSAGVDNLHGNGIKMITHTDFSSQYGFGSSSAATVCVIKGLSEYMGLSLGNREIFNLAYKTVLDVQGKGSGFDIAAAVYGGTLYFMTGGKVIEPIQIDELPIIVGYSGVKADTVTLINMLAYKAKSDPSSIDGSYNEIARLVDSAKSTIVEKKWQLVGSLMNQNQELLKSLGVSTDKLDAMIEAARDAGAYGAKLSGAGGGDCMIAVAPRDKTQAVKDAITAAGGLIIEVESNVGGVKVEAY
ncbi:mevalonate kinase [Candidatus Microgenomates bacterium]|nr:mevalonate kinase [Candidatus Microgenomates bacterium]